MFAMTTTTSVAHGKPDAGKLARPVWGEERENLLPEGGVASRSYSTRLSRSLLDFAKMMEVFEKHNVSFVSVTQQINTGTSMGRLMMNVLLSFAQFEREIIGERTRDKIAATRRKGKWSGGQPILGYDVREMKLVVNHEEAERVRAIFELYLQKRTLRPVVEELQRRGWRNKCWRTRQRQERGGYPFSKTSVHLLLTNVLYAGNISQLSQTQIRHLGEA
jgi:site-specific DNA recombinase